MPLPTPPIVVIAEKRSQGTAIAKALAHPATPQPIRGPLAAWFIPHQHLAIAAVDGHLCQLPRPDDVSTQWGAWSWESLPILPLPNQLQPTIAPQCQQAISFLRQLSAHAHEVVNGCDAGREGELIFSWIMAVLRLPQKQVSRLWLHSLDPKEIQQAFHDRPQAHRFLPLQQSATARAHFDWIIGHNWSRAASLAFRTLRPEHRAPVPIGRVQTPVLAAIVNQARDCARFSPQFYYSGSIAFAPPEGDPFNATLLAPEGFRFGQDRRWTSYDSLTQHLHAATLTSTQPWSMIESLRTVPEAPPTLFDSTELVRALARLFGWSASRADDAAQAAYLRGLISYPRTNCHRLPPHLAPHLQQWLSQAWSSFPWSHPPGDPPHIGPDNPHIFDPEFNSDHHAIIPLVSSRQPPPDHLPINQDALVVLDLVTRRTLTALSPPATIQTCSRILTPTAPEPDFQLTALYEHAAVLSPGWLWTDTAVGGSSIPRPNLQARDTKPDQPAGSFANLVSTSVRSHTTSPPQPFTDDSLLYYMQRHHLGTPATRSDAIATLLQRQLISRDSSGHYTPTELGASILDLLESIHLDAAISPMLSALIETGLEKAAQAPSPKRSTKIIDDISRQVLAYVRDGVLRLHTTAHQQPELPALCPKSLCPVTQSEDGFHFQGFPSVRFPSIFAGRTMTAHDYRAVLLAGSRGGPLFDGFRKKATGETFSARLRFLPRKRTFRFA